MSMIFFIAALFGSLINPYCSCHILGKIDEVQYNQYSLILKGKIEKVRNTRFQKFITVKVDEFYKRESSKPTVTIISPRYEGECGIIPKIGETWLVFATKTKKGFETHLCTRTRNINPKAWDYNKEEVDDDIRFLKSKMGKIKETCFSHPPLASYILLSCQTICTCFLQ